MQYYIINCEMKALINASHSIQGVSTMRKKTYAGVIITLSALLLMIFAGCAANKEQLQTIESQKKELQASQNRIRNLEAQIKDLQSKLDETQSSIDRLDKDKQGLSSQISGLR